MPEFKISVDQSLDAAGGALAMRVGQKSVLVSKSLADALAPYALGNDAFTVASFLASFPSAVAGSLGLNPATVSESAKHLVEQLEQSEGGGHQRPEAAPAMPPLGAHHPGWLHG